LTLRLIWIKTMSKWVWFDDVTQSYPNAKKKTRTWNVFPLQGIYLLGKVKWHATWRAYCFFPAADMLFNAECLNDIAEFCRENRAVRNDAVVTDVPKHAGDPKFGTVPVFPDGKIIVGRCIGCFHDFRTGPCGGCGAIPGPNDVLSMER
jgi:hypothetical protein